MGEPDWFCRKCGAYYGDETVVPERCSGTSFSPDCRGKIEFCEPNLVGLDDEGNPIVDLEPIEEDD